MLIKRKARPFDDQAGELRSAPPRIAHVSKMPAPNWSAQQDSVRDASEAECPGQSCLPETGAKLLAWPAPKPVTRFPRNPLRVVVARMPVSVDLPGDRSTIYFLETLSCQHQVIVPLDWEWDESGHMVETAPKAKRHRCSECAAGHPSCQSKAA
jgi:hypothetical protein